MKAAVLEEVRVLSFKTVDTPSPTDGSVLVRVGACAICGTDLRIFRHGHHRVTLPQIIGHEIVGTVHAVGSGVDDLQVGDDVAVSPRIACGHCHYCLSGRCTYCETACSFGYQIPGGFAEFVLVPAQGVRAGVLNPLPASLSHEVATLTEPLACSIRAQRASGVTTESVVCVIGAGPVGLLHCRLARATGAEKVLLLERDPARLGEAAYASADDVVDVGRYDGQQAVLAATSGRGADVVIVACSTVEAQEMSLALAAKGGRVNFFGGLPLGAPGIRLDSNLVHYREITIQGSHSSSPAENAEALDMLGDGRVRGEDLIGRVFPLDSILEAFDYAESRRGLKAVVRP